MWSPEITYKFIDSVCSNILHNQLNMIISTCPSLDLYNVEVVEYIQKV